MKVPLLVSPLGISTTRTPSMRNLPPLAFLIVIRPCGPHAPIQSDACDLGTGATGASAALGSQPLVQIGHLGRLVGDAGEFVSPFADEDEIVCHEVGSLPAGLRGRGQPAALKSSS